MHSDRLAWKRSSPLDNGSSTSTAACVAQVFGLAAGRLAVEHAEQSQIDALMLTVAGATPQCQRLLP
jgi:hypothetical protein